MVTSRDIKHHMKKTFQQCFHLEKKLQKAVNKGIRKGRIHKNAAYLHIENMKGPYFTVSNMDYMSFDNALSTERKVTYTHQDAQILYAMSFLKRTLMQQDIAQDIRRRIRRGQLFSWQLHLYRTLGAATQYYPVNDLVLDYPMSNWVLFEPAIQKAVLRHQLFHPSQGDTLNDTGLYASIALIVYGQFCAYLEKSGKTAEELMENTPIEWLIPIFWDGKIQEGIAGITASHVDQDEIATQHLMHQYLAK